MDFLLSGLNVGHPGYVSVLPVAEGKPGLADADPKVSTRHNNAQKPRRHRDHSFRISAAKRKCHVLLIAMDDSDWAIHDSNLAARWRMLADFD